MKNEMDEMETGIEAATEWEMELEMKVKMEMKMKQKILLHLGSCQ